ncbi:MAG: YceD family protein [Deltaproteobacteria bacterium]
MTNIIEPMPLNWTIDIADVPERGLKGLRTATETERVALSKALDLLSCEALEVTYSITPLAGGYRLEGGIDAAVNQACVITLEPIASRVAESFSVDFRRDPSRAVDEEGDIEILSGADVEPLMGEQIELGRIVYEALSAGLDPYPRKPGAEFDWSDPKQSSTGSNPFAVLGKLKDRS